MFITDPNFFHPPEARVKKVSASASKNSSILTQNIVLFLSSRKYDLGSSSRIRVSDPDLGFCPSWFQGSKRHRIPDPGYGAATLDAKVIFYIDPARVRPRGTGHHLSGGFPHQERSGSKGGSVSHACKNSPLSAPDPNPVGIQIRFQEGKMAPPRK
jgi:hypothetical protein